MPSDPSGTSQNPSVSPWMAVTFILEVKRDLMIESRGILALFLLGHMEKLSRVIGCVCNALMLCQCVQRRLQIVTAWLGRIRDKDKTDVVRILKATVRLAWLFWYGTIDPSRQNE
jgi:hypothetical protein